MKPLCLRVIECPEPDTLDAITILNLTGIVKPG